MQRRYSEMIRKSTLWIALLLVGTTAAQAQKTIPVQADDYAISTALNLVAEPGDTLLLVTDGGVYRDTTIHVTKDIVIKADPTLAERPVLATQWDDVDTTWTQNMIQIDEGDVTINGLLMGEEEDSANVAIFNNVVGGNTIRIHDLEVREMASGVYRQNNPITVTDSLIVTDSYFHHLDNNAISAAGDRKAEIPAIRYLKVENTTMYNLSDKGIGIRVFSRVPEGEPPTVAEIEHVTIDSVKLGVVLDGFDPELSMVENSIVARATNAGIKWKGDPLQVEHDLLWRANNPVNGDITVGEEVIIGENPLFADVEDGDHSLEAGSPALGAASDGTDLGDLSWSTQTNTAVDDAQLPLAITLRQNYPNPFNPTTEIRYGLSKTEHVRLTVYDMLGRQVAKLVDGRQAAGAHAVSFEAAELSSGMYLYRLETAGTVKTRAMTVLK